MLNIGIVAHTSRSTQAKALARTVHADFVSIDNGMFGCDDNHDHVMHHLAGLPSTWSVVLEDDAIPVDGLRAQLDAALPLSPAPIVSLYLGQLRPPQHQADIRAAVEAAEGAGQLAVAGKEGVVVVDILCHVSAESLWVVRLAWPLRCAR